MDKQSVMTVDKQGARVELVLAGVPVLGRVTRGDGKTASTHPCTPNFAQYAAGYDLAQHGFGRTIEWTVIQKSEDTVILEAAFVPGYPAAGKKKYPDGLVVRQEHRLMGGMYELTTIHRNTGLESLPVNFGEHNYFVAQQGWSGVSVNGTDVTEAVKRNNFIVTREENVIELSGKPRIWLRQKGFGFFKLWSYGSRDTGYDGGYVCIEPVELNPDNGFGTQESLIEPGQSRISRMSISLNP